MEDLFQVGSDYGSSRGTWRGESVSLPRMIMPGLKI